MLPVPVLKEVRALLLPWLACAAAMALPTIAGVGSMRGFPVLAYPIGAIILGALSVGHEYSGRTLSLLLSLPVRRERLYLTKFSVLTAMLLALAGLEWWVYPVSPAHVPPLGADEIRYMWVLLPALAGLCVAPWLTMATRSPMAGAIFTFVAPGLLLLAAQVIWAASGRPGSLDPFRTMVLWQGMFALSAIGAAAGWRLFMRLEATGEHDTVEIRLPEWLRRRVGSATAATPRSRRRPIWMLVRKELRLQQLSMVVAAIYLIGAQPILTLEPRTPSLDLFVPLSTFYALLLAMVIGSFGSAEERRLGTLEWQLQLPVASASQWLVKTEVVFGLTLLLAGGLPMVLGSYWPGVDPAFTSASGFASLARWVLLASAGALYVSSLSASGVWAFLTSLPAALAAGVFTIYVSAHLASWGISAGVPRPWRVTYTLNLPLYAGLIGMLLWFALANHRAADRSAWRVVTQVAVIAAYATAWMAILT
jgi:hypothetical protein